MASWKSEISSDVKNFRYGKKKRTRMRTVKRAKVEEQTKKKIDEMQMYRAVAVSVATGAA